MAASLRVDVPGVDFEQMAREAIAEKVTEAMIGADDAVRKIVAGALTQKVNQHGKVGSSYENTIPFVEWLAHDLIRQATIDVLQKRIAALKPDLEAALEKELRRSTKATAKALATAFADRATTAWSLKVEVIGSDR